MDEADDLFRSMTAIASARSKSVCKQPQMPLDSPRPEIPSPETLSPPKDETISKDDESSPTASTATSRPAGGSGGSGRNDGNVSSGSSLAKTRIASTAVINTTSDGSSFPWGTSPRLQNAGGLEPVASPSNSAPHASSRKAEGIHRAQRGFTLQELRGELQASFRELNMKAPAVAGEIRSEIRDACNATTESLRRDMQMYIKELKHELRREREDLVQWFHCKCKNCSGDFSSVTVVGENRLSSTGGVQPMKRGSNISQEGGRIANLGHIPEGRMKHDSSHSGKDVFHPESYHGSGFDDEASETSTLRNWGPLAVSNRSSTRKNTARRSIHVQMHREEAEQLLPSRNMARNSPSGHCPSLAHLVLSDSFNHLASVVVLLYTAAIGVETDYVARNWSEPTPRHFIFVEVCFASFFVLEICLRIFVQGVRFFYCVYWKQNLFDLFLVSLQLFQLVASLLVEPPFLRSFKLLRCLRLIRVLHMVGELRTLTISIMNSVRSLLWSMLLLMLITFVFGVTLTDIVASTRRMSLQKGIVREVPARRMQEFQGTPEEAIEEYYGSLSSTMLLLYESISEGRHWGALVDPLVVACSPWLAILFSVYMSFMLFAMLNVLTAFFVESTLRVAEEDKKRHMMSELWEAFRPSNNIEPEEVLEEYQAEHSITLEEFQKHLDNPKMKAFLDALDLDPQSALESPFFHLIDTDGSGEVDADELVSGCLRLTGGAKSFDVLSFAHDYRDDARNLKEFCTRTELALVRLEDLLHDFSERNEGGHY
eukprot:TRINITY_DN16703_c0_g1_i1.p1 TRINITY_DN16703_c0_g1~~TRINITY_DN16703_c0_g1_i1.p1  ORF type:complete len:768 (-),score=127.14 TRINITY_DN16703_c0_g1_i1:261-2564(-)